MPAVLHRLTIAAASLLVSTACLAQGVSAGAAAAAAAAPDAGTGVFRPVNPAAQERQPATSTPVYALGKEYRIGPNDLIDFEVLNVENGKRTVRVNAAGAITLPLVGSVVVAGLTQQQAEAHVAALYGDKYLQDPQVSIFIKEFTTERITVDGAVTKPGIYPLVGQMTLLRALALAGGFGPMAEANSVMLFRQGDQGERQVASFNVERIRAGKDPDPPIRGDDLIVVQRNTTRALLKDSLFRDVLDSINPFNILGR